MKRFTGIVVRASTAKTVFVEVAQEWVHPKYQKKMNLKRVFPTHDEVGVSVGDQVVISECKPMSATKFFKVEEVVKKNA